MHKWIALWGILSAAAVLELSGQQAGVARVDPAFDKLVPAAAQIEKLAGGLGFTEGPVWVREGGGCLLFSDIPKIGRASCRERVYVLV